MPKKSEDMREISVAEFFEKNRHLLGFDSKRKALYTVIKEMVDNSLDACEDMKILPDIIVRIQRISGDRFKVTVEDNGKGIPSKHVPKAFGKLLYGSKFHKFKQSRGQQGIGISACVLYSQLTTGEPTTVISKYIKEDDAYFFRLFIDIKKNEPKVIEKKKINWFRDHGVSVSMQLQAEWTSKVFDYIRYTAIANPYARITLYTPDGNVHLFKRKVREMPEPPKEIKPHPYGVELGLFLRMAEETNRRTIKDFLSKEFSSIGEGTVYFVLYKAFINEKADQDSFSFEKLPKDVKKELERIAKKNPKEFSKKELEKIWKTLQETKLRRPPTNALIPIGEKHLEKSLMEELKPEFVAVITRKPSVYRGIPYQVEVGIAYGGEIKGFELIRLANKVPLMYEQGSCAITKAVQEVDWKRYGLDVDGKGFPRGPIVILVHFLSIWVPFTSESKMAIANYPEIIKEIKLAVMEVARKLGEYLSKKRREKEIGERFRKFVIYGMETVKVFASMFGKDEETVKKEIMIPIIKRALREYSEIVISELGKDGNPEEIAEKLINKHGLDKIMELFGFGKFKEIRNLIMGELI